MRKRWGCDVDCADAYRTYCVRCPTCDGTRSAVRQGLEGEALGDPCLSCEGWEGPLGDSFEGYRMMPRCPRSMLDAEVSHAYAAHQQVQNGRLPAAGTWRDQTASFVAFCDALDRESGEVRAEQAAEDRKKAERR